MAAMSIINELERHAGRQNTAPWQPMGMGSKVGKEPGFSDFGQGTGPSGKTRSPVRKGSIPADGHWTGPTRSATSLAFGGTRQWRHAISTRTWRVTARSRARASATWASPSRWCLRLSARLNFTAARVRRSIGSRRLPCFSPARVSGPRRCAAQFRLAPARAALHSPQCDAIQARESARIQGCHIGFRLWIGPRSAFLARPESTKSW